MTYANKVTHVRKTYTRTYHVGGRSAILEISEALSGRVTANAHCNYMAVEIIRWGTRLSWGREAELYLQDVIAHMYELLFLSHTIHYNTRFKSS